MSEYTPDARRPLTSRNTAWARWLSRRLAATAITPNQISLASIGFALVGGLLLLRPDWPVALVFAAICIQLRLLCNLIDGMVAVEGGKGTPTGALYNEIPDRIADSLFLIGAGYGIGLPALGWFAALAAAITAYIRVLGGSLGRCACWRSARCGPLCAARGRSRQNSRSEAQRSEAAAGPAALQKRADRRLLEGGRPGRRCCCGDPHQNQKRPPGRRPSNGNRRPQAGSITRTVSRSRCRASTRRR